MVLKKIALAAALACLATTVHAEEFSVPYASYPVASPTARALWIDFVDGMSGRAVAGDAGAVLVAAIDFAGDRWTVTQIDDVAYCGANACSTRIFRNDDLMFSGEVCSNVQAHQLRPDALQFRACEETFPLAVIDQR